MTTMATARKARTVSAGVVAGLLLALVFVAPAVAAPKRGDSAFNAGVAAYRAGQYPKALKSFQAAERAGLKSQNLDLNLGLTYYQLGRYDEARPYFERVRNDLRYTQIADYHLGVMAGKKGERDEAMYYLGSVQSLSTSTDLRDMASLQMRRLEDTSLDEEVLTPDVDVPDGTYYARVAAGYDSNPELSSGAVNRPVSDEGAGYVDLRANLEHPLGTGDFGTTLFRADVALRQHNSEDGYDHQSGELGLRQSWRVGRWRYGLGGEGGAAWLDGEAYQGVGAVNSDARRRFGETQLTLRAEVQNIAGEGEYRYLDGWRQRAEAQLARTIDRYRVRADAEYEYNDREDRRVGEAFNSYSPQRGGFGLAVATPALREVALEFRARWRRSDYRGVERNDVDGTIVEAQREDTLVSTGVRARMRGGATWNWLGDYQYSRNQSTIAADAYARHVATVGIEFLR